MRSAWKAYALAPVAFLVLGLAGCDGWRIPGFGTDVSVADPIDDPLADTPEDAADEAIGAQPQNTGNNSTPLQNVETGIELTLPSAWAQDIRLHDSAELQASDVSNELYIVVVAEDDRTLNRLGLQENAARYRQLLINQLQSFQGQSPTEVAFIGEDTNFANQYEIRGTVDDDTSIVYLHTTVVTEDRYYQIVAWTTPEQYTVHKSELQAITDTFREMDSASDT
ncbi:MAG: hypothetical protein ACFBSF_01925 [Leptolyngbyaceae cyanobacterium]